MTETASYRPLALGPWLLLVTILNLIWLSSGSFGPDLKFWTEWTLQLSTQGYSNYSANYPPVYIHWLSFVASLHSLLGLPIVEGAFLKILTMTPVWAAHLLLLTVIWRILRKRESETKESLPILALASINPAILMNGPAWGQVDLLFALPIAIALGWLIHGRRLLWALPLLTLAFLLKFQTIAVAAVVGGLIWRHRMAILPSLPISAGLALLLIFPFLWAGSLGNMIREAYLQSASTYPMASFNAANLWYLLGLNQMSDIRFLLDSSRDAQGWEIVFTPKILGMASFALLSLYLMIDTIRHTEISRNYRNAFLSVLGFFLLLPAMHERYLFLAVPIALVATAYIPRFFWIAVAFTFANFLNTGWVMPPHDGALGIGLATGTVLFGIVLLWGRQIPWNKLDGWASRWIWPWILFSVLLWGYQLGNLGSTEMEKDRSKSLPAGWLKATKVQELDVQQGWGSLHIDQSVIGNPLFSAGKVYGFGFGTHAPSTIRIPIPEGSIGFTTRAGVDDEAMGGKVVFRILVDGQKRWESGVVQGGNPPVQAKVKLRGEKWLELQVDAYGSNEFDHADWLEPAFKVQAD